MRPFDVGTLLERLDAWCASQHHVRARLWRAPPMSDSAIDAIPGLLESFPFPLPTPYDPAKFVIPDGYRALLRRCGGMHIETWTDDDEPAIWDVLRLFQPGDCSRTHCGAHHTLCSAWTVAGTSVDDRAFTTTEFVSFATAGMDVEASRWCFYLGEAGAPAIHMESNDYECLLGKYVDTGEWISEHSDPLFPNFESWLCTLVDVITEGPLLDPESNDALIDEVYARGHRML